VRLAVIDHVVSQAPAHLPVAALCALCSAAGALSLVDGAHAVGALPLCLPRLGADFYTSNAHKWLCCGKGVALLWAAPRHQARLLPLVTSHGHGLVRGDG
jgi:isopenicillin-N epimerase